MNQPIKEDIENVPQGILSKEHIDRARIILGFHCAYLLVITVRNSGELATSSIISIGPQLLFYGFVFCYNYAQFSEEKNEDYTSTFPKWATLVFILAIGIMVFSSVTYFLSIVSTHLLQFKVIIYLMIIISLCLIYLKEINYLKPKDSL